jgi:hypothetical protein
MQKYENFIIVQKQQDFIRFRRSARGSVAIHRTEDGDRTSPCPKFISSTVTWTRLRRDEKPLKGFGLFSVP